MDKSRLALIVENSRLCHIANKYGGEAAILKVYDGFYGEQAPSLLHAVSRIAKNNVNSADGWRII